MNYRYLTFESITSSKSNTSTTRVQNQNQILICPPFTNQNRNPTSIIKIDIKSFQLQESSTQHLILFSLSILVSQLDNE